MMHASLFRGPTRRVCAKPISHLGCTIRAYPAHAKELSNPNPDSVHFFYKPYSAAFQLADGGVVPIPTRFGEVSHEIEICILIGSTPLPSPCAPGATFDPAAVKRSIEGIGLGLDWTLRDTQAPLTKGGLPWERAKAFDRSAALTAFADMTPAAAAAGNDSILFSGAAPDQFPRLTFSLTRNGKDVQLGDTSDISFCPLTQIWEMHKVTRLRHGDVVMTGTPPGVGVVAVGDTLRLRCDLLGIDYTVTVVPEETVEGVAKL